MKEQRVKQILHEIAGQQVPQSVDLWPAIRVRLQPPRRRSRWARLMPTTRLGWAFLALALCLLIGTGAWAVGSAVDRLFQVDPGLNHVGQAGLSQELDLSQALDGVTVTLERAYADANRVVVGYTVSSSDGQRYDPRSVTLTDAAGTVFSGTMGMGVTGKSEVLQVELPPGEGSYVTSFDASAVEGVPEELNLRLVIKVEELVLPSDAPGPSPTPTGSPAEPSEPMVVELLPMPEGAVVGPFTFDFSVPFIPGRTVEVQQTAEAAGVAVTLRRVVVTPSETQATLCFDPPDGDSKEWLLIAAGDGQDLAGGAVIQPGGSSEECHRVIYPGDLAGRPGTWTLTVTELVGFDLSPSGEQTRLAGPWVFRFYVP